MAELKKARLLAVEDNAETRMLLGHLLRSRYTLVLTGQVDDALTLAAEQSFDVFLLDINLGEVRTGMDLLRLLRANPRHAGTPAIAMTAYTLPGDRDQFITAGFNSYLSKPFTRPTLLATIDGLLAQEQER